MWTSLVLITVTGWLLQGVQSAHWVSSIQDGDELFLCVGANITLPWEYELSPGDVLTDVLWLYNGESEELIAMVSHDQFIVLPAYTGRVEQVTNGGIVVNTAAVSDTGNYTVEIQGYDDDGDFFLLLQTVIVHISDDLMTQDGELHVQQSGAVLNQDTDQWSIQLTCGLFIFRDSPPFYVVWTTPDGSTYNSTDFSDGNFRLLLDNPVRGGNYTCRIPSHLQAAACLQGNDADEGEATLIVDELDARLTLLEQENEQLKLEYSVLTNSTEDMFSQLEDEDQQLRNEDQQLAQRIDWIDTEADRQVTFHATLLRSNNPSSDTPLIFRDVVTNQGDAYNDTTGYFTAPYPGTYFFVATSGTLINGSSVTFEMYIDSTPINSIIANNNHGLDALSTLHGVAHLNVGQRAWIRSNGDSYFESSSFSGFLLSSDP